MVINRTIITTGNTYFPPNQRDVAGLRKITFGLGFPMGGERLKGGLLKNTTGIDTIKDAVQQLLRTQRGERVMLPKFGCNLRKYVFQPLTEATFESIKREIMYSFSRYIVGAKIKKLRVVPYGELGPGGGNSLLVSLIIQLNEEDLTVFDVEVVVK